MSGADDALTSESRLQVDVTSLASVGVTDVERFSNNSDSGDLFLPHSCFLPPHLPHLPSRGCSPLRKHPLPQCEASINYSAPARLRPRATRDSSLLRFGSVLCCAERCIGRRRLRTREAPLSRVGSKSNRNKIRRWRTTAHGVVLFARISIASSSLCANTDAIVNPTRADCQQTSLIIQCFPTLLPCKFVRRSSPLPRSHGSTTSGTPEVARPRFRRKHGVGLPHQWGSCYSCKTSSSRRSSASLITRSSRIRLFVSCLCLSRCRF